jgi:nitrate reductase NapA
MVENYLTFREGDAERTFEDLKRHVARYTPERVAPVCGVDARQIEEVAYLFAASEATMSIWTMGLNQQAQGTAANRLVNAMHLLTGHIGRPGATPFSLTGQPNAGGGVRDTGALAHALPNGRVVANPQHRAEMEDLWGVPRGRISPKPGYHAVAMFEAMVRGDLKCVLIMGTNPAQSLPHAERYREAMQRTFLVVADAIYPTETAQFADVFLPSAMWVEKGGVFSQSERRYHLVPKLVDPPGEARSDLEILVELADRLGYGDLIKARTPEEVWDEWRQISAHSPYNFAGITYERLKKERGILWPAPTEDHPGTCRRYVPGEDPMAKGSGRFDFYGRPDGRAVVYLEHQQPPSDPRSDEYPLTLVTGRVYEHWHTLTITGKLEELEDIITEFLVVHPRDAHRYGIRDGEPVLVESQRGRAVLKARVSTDITPGIVFAPFHSPEALVNRVVNNTVDPISKEPAFKESAVRIQPASSAA